MLMGTKTSYFRIRPDFDESNGGVLDSRATRAPVVSPHLYIHKRQFQNLLNLIRSSCSSSSSSSQVNTARLRLMNVVPSPVSTMEHVLTYQGGTHASVLQVCGHVT